jgi:peptidoglycan/LPS O-acetylase OafA/YrhL
MFALVVFFELWRILFLRVPRPPEAYFRTDLNLGVILLGCVFALGLQNARVKGVATRLLYPWAAVLYTLAVYAWNAFHHSRSQHALAITVFPILITATMLHPQSWWTRLLELPPLRFVGKISFSLYLWQQLFLDRYVPPPPHTLRSHSFLCWVLTFCCAIASYILIETPMIRIGHRIAKRFDLQKVREHQAKLETA